MIYSIYAATFTCFGHGCGDGVSVDNIQKEISWVVVWFTEIASNTDQNDYWVFHIHSWKGKVNRAFWSPAWLPMLAK